jgi:hypothetical protein
MKALLVLAVALTGAASSTTVAAEEQLISSARARPICVQFPDRRTSARRICLTASAWRERLGPDWRQILTGRNVEDDMDALGPRTRSNPRLPAGACNVC